MKNAFITLFVIGVFTISQAKSLKPTPTITPDESEKTQAMEKIKTNNPDWFKKYVEIIQRGKSEDVAIRNKGNFYRDEKDLERLFVNKDNTLVMKLWVSSSLALDWDNFQQIYPTPENRLQFKKWRGIYLRLLDGLNGEVTDKTEDAVTFWDEFQGFRKQLDESYTQTPEGNAEGLLDEGCKINAVIARYRGEIIKQKRIENEGGVIDLKARRDLVEVIVHNQEKLDELKASYKRTMKRDMSLSLCK